MREKISPLDARRDKTPIGYHCRHLSDVGEMLGLFHQPHDRVVRRVCTYSEALS